MNEAEEEFQEQVPVKELTMEVNPIPDADFDSRSDLVSGFLDDPEKFL
jgi:hypothetical protein